jgi:ubiquitin carboxyl-terminal hydrolase 1
MNSLQDRANDSPTHNYSVQTNTYPVQTKVISTVALLVLGYYVLSLFDAWPSTLQRSLYELALAAIPSPLIYATEKIMVRTGYLRPGGPRFERADFGNAVAKQEAMRRMFGPPQLPLALQRVRSLSGPLMSFSNDIGPPGLGNWDNSCYQNSVLQGFASLPAFLQYMEQSEKFCNKFGVPTATHSAMVELLTQLADPSRRTSVLWTPGVLKSMDSWQQQDAQEYFSRVLDAIEKEAKVCSKRLIQSQLAGLGCLSPAAALETAVQGVEDTDDAGQPATSRPKDGAGSNLELHVPRNPIEGMTAQCLQCKTCGFTEGLSLTQFSCLTLNLGLQGDSDINDLLNEYTAAEEIEGVECDHCTKLSYPPKDDSVPDVQGASEKSPAKKKAVLRTKTKQITIGRLPKNLVLHINRSIFDNYGNQLKNTAPVTFPMRLDFLSRWCAPLQQGNPGVEAVYELKCIVTHYGSHHDGHYIALAQRGKNWFSLNDERVSQVSTGEVLARGNAFMLFYEAVDLPAASVQHLSDEPATASQEEDLELEGQTADLYQDVFQDAEATVNETEEMTSGASQEDTAVSHSEFEPSSGDISQNSTPATSGASSPVKSAAGEHRQGDNCDVPIMKMAQDIAMSEHGKQETTVPAVSVL